MKGEDVVLQLNPEGGFVVGSTNDLDPGMLSSALAIRDRSESLPPQVRRLLAAIDRGDPAFGVTDAPLPDGAVAVVIRDGNQDPSRLVLVDGAATNDWILTLAPYARGSALRRSR
ncbi:MAG TPA: hypothetical protein VFL93_04190 [Longimicrobiaceae bacterium]|nr:hypothetical protein [Longimicrobiaceae bacterium]